MLPVTVTINYPPDLDTLNLWSKVLFVIYSMCGIVSGLSLLGSVFLAFKGQPGWLPLGLPVAGLLSGAAHELERVMCEVDRRRFELIELYGSLNADKQ